MRHAGPLAALALAGVLAPAARAQRLGEHLDDLRQATAVRLALVADAATRPLDVAVSARADVVTLSGDVASPLASDRAEGVARGVEGVGEVVNQLAVVELTASVRLDGDEPEGEAEAAAPDPPPQERPGEDTVATHHTVQIGDTLFNLARRYGTTVEELRRLNGLGRETALALGQRLRVR